MKLNSGTSAIVSGGASGLGAAVAEHLSGLGVRVGILDLNEAEGTRLADKIGGTFGQVDVTDASSVSKALSTVRAEIGQERICVNCAGIAPSAKTISRGAVHDAALFEKVLGVNLLGTFNVATQSALGMSDLPAMNADGERGVIINTSSIAAFEGQMGQIAYAASKAGVAGMTLPMARDLTKTGVRVLAIAPGIFGTPMVTSFPQDVQDALAANIPFPSRLGKPEEFAALVAFLASNSMMNGEVVRIDGATRMQAK